MSEREREREEEEEEEEEGGGKCERDRVGVRMPNSMRVCGT